MSPLKGFDLEVFPKLLEALPIGVVLVDAQGHIAFVNRPLGQQFGYVEDEIPGQPIEVLLPVPARTLHPALRMAFFANPEARPMGAGRDLRGRRKDGSEFPVEIGLSPIDLQAGRDQQRAGTLPYRSRTKRR